MLFPLHTVQTLCPTALGTVHLAATPQGLCGLWFHDQRHRPAQLTGAAAWPLAPEHPVLRAAGEQLPQWLSGARQSFDLPLDLSGGTPFQQRVWQALLAIGWGETRSYSQLAQAIGAPAAVRAVGAAVGRNPISLVVPCHRVLGAGGALTGYAGGLERKRALLALEAAAAGLLPGAAAANTVLRRAA